MRLGVPHLESIWSRAQAALRGEAAARAPAALMLDRAVLDELGVGREPAYRFLLDPYASRDGFERWIEEQNGGSVAPWRIARANEVAGDAGRDPAVQRRLDAIDRLPPALDDDDLGFFDEHGYVILRGAVAGALCTALAGAVGDQPRSRKHGIMVQLFDHPVQREIRELPRIHKAFAQLWGSPDLVATVDRAGFNAPERDGVPFPGPGVHLDLISLEPPIPFGVQGLIYLTDTPAEQGAFQCVPGFHHRIDHDPPPTLNVEYMTGEPIPGAAGDMVIWHQALPHGATPNRGERPRIVQYLKLYPPPAPAPGAPSGRRPTAAARQPA
jgi:phytanoyl-CoA dioxygenase PhyH